MNNIPVLDLLSHGQEGLLDIRRVLRRRFEEWDRKLIREVLWGRSDTALI